MVRPVIDACREAGCGGCGKIVVVVGYKRELVERELAGEGGIVFAVQHQQRGTGDAVEAARGALAAEIERPGTPVFVLAGDGPLIRASTLTTLLERHVETGAAATLATAVLDDPSGYGRIIRERTSADGRGEGGFVGIVEEKHCTDEQRRVREVNPSYYCFDGAALFEALRALRPHGGDDGQVGEYYITDVPSVLLSRGLRVEVIDAVPPEDVLSINTPEQLRAVDEVYRARRSAHAERSI